MSKPTFTIYSGLDTLDDAVVAAWQEPHYAGVDHSLVWYRCLAPRVLQDGGTLRVVIVRDESGTPLAALPLVLRKNSAGPFQLVGLRGLANFYSALCEPVFFTPERSPAVFVALVDAVHAIESWSSLDLNPLAADSELTGKLRHAFEQQGVFVHSYFRFANWYLDLDGRDFAAYQAALPSKLRDTVKRKHRRLKRDYDSDIEIVVDAPRAAVALEQFADVYALSWKRTEPHPGFIREVASEFARRGWLRLGTLRIDGEVVAAQIWFVFGGTASIFKLAHDSKHNALSVGSILTMELMRHVIDVDGVDHVDFLVGDDTYKRDWMSARRERVGLRMYRYGTLAGTLGVARSKLSGMVNWRPRQARIPQVRKR